MDTSGTQKPMDLETLAIMVAEGFRDVMERLDQKADKSDIIEIKGDINNIESRLNNIEQSQEHMRLRLDQVAYQIDVKDLTRRVEILEYKNGITK